jgi:uncharacterized HAD superfamily protein
MRIALDIDDVLAGFASGVHEAFDREVLPHDHWDGDDLTGHLLLKTNLHGDVIGYKQAYLDKCEHNAEFWYSLEPISLPADIPEGAVCYITSSPKNMVETRLKWLAKHGFPQLPVIHSKDKAVTMERLKIDLLIDDKLDTVKEVRRAGLRAVHFQPWYSTLKEKDSIKHLRDLRL